MNPLEYNLAEMLMFSSDAWYRMVELYNRQIWPVQIFALLAGMIAIVLCGIRFKFQGRIIAGMLVLSWLWTGYGFLIAHFSTINWFAYGYAVVYFMQAVLLIRYGLHQDRINVQVTRSPVSIAGMFLLGYGVLAHPLVSISIIGLPNIEIAGLMPTPTLIATLGILLMIFPRPLPVLLIIPFLSAAVGGSTAWQLGMYEALAAPLAAILALVALVFNRISGIGTNYSHH